MALVKRGLAALGVVAMLLFSQAIAPTHAGAASIQPGDFMHSDGKSCTLGFVATSGADTFFLSAAHCVEQSAPVELADGTILGDVVTEGDAESEIPATSRDWALIRVRPHLVANVVAAVRGSAGTPTGVALESETGFGDLIKHSGYGLGFDMIDVTREQRYGVLVDHSTGEWVSIGSDIFGDSGGPVIHVATGRALGLVSRLCVGTCTSLGPTIEGVFQQAAAAGYPLVLRTG
jgi:hypothetical protein